MTPPAVSHDLARAAWDKLVAEVGPDCSGDAFWCAVHHASMPPMGSRDHPERRCFVRRALDEMTVVLENLLSDHPPWAHHSERDPARHPGRPRGKDET